MEDKIMFEKGNRTLKNPKHFEKKFFYFILQEMLLLL